MNKSKRKSLLTKPKQAPPACPRHSKNSPCKLVQNGGRVRNAKTDEGPQATQVRVQRYLCKTHRVSVTWIPRELLPHIHYKAPIVNERVWRYVDGEGIPAPDQVFGPPHPKTVRRWIRRLTKNPAKLSNKVYRVMGLKETEKKDRKGYSSHDSTLKLLQTWGLLKLLSQTLPERRVPYHYAYDLMNN